MPGEEAHFNAPGSVFSQLNTAGNTNPGVGGIMATDSTGPVNAKTMEGESQMDSHNTEYKSTRESQYQDPAVASNKEMGKIKNPDPVKGTATKDVETSAETSGQVNGTDVTANVDTGKKESNREDSDSEQSWLQREAMAQINNKMSDATGNVKDNESTDAKNPDTSTQKSKKPGVGQVPAIDQTRQSPPTIPTDRPKPTYPMPSSGPSPKTPAIKPPKLSVPKMKLR
jgi:hypothetical protein